MENEKTFSHWYFRHPAHQEIAQSRYYLKDSFGKLIETDISQCFVRVTKHLTGICVDLDDRRIQKDVTTVDVLQYNDAVDILQHMLEKRLLPGGRVLAQSGTKTTNLNNCFVLHSADNKQAILNLQKNHFLIQSGGGGVGINASVWRPRWSWVAGNNARSCGAIGWVSLLSTQSALISQSGNRSGANLCLLEDWHPDLLDYIDWKTIHNWSSVISEFASIYDPSLYNLSELCT